jgi:hypothetical protein
MMDLEEPNKAADVSSVVESGIPTGESDIPADESGISTGVSDIPADEEIGGVYKSDDTGESDIPADEEIGGVDKSDDTGEGKQSCCRKHKLGISLLVITLLVVGGGIAAWLLTKKSEETPILLLLQSRKISATSGFPEKERVVSALPRKPNNAEARFAMSWPNPFCMRWTMLILLLSTQEYVLTISRLES